MFGSDFFNGVTRRVDTWMGELFRHKNVSPAELKAMDYAELRYWYSWWEPEKEHLLELARRQKDFDKR
jgi:hypothetical protein